MEPPGQAPEGLSDGRAKGFGHTPVGDKVFSALENDMEA